MKAAKLAIAAAAVIAALALSPCPAAAESLTVFGNDSFMPFVYPGPRGEADGAATQLLREVLAAAGFDADIQLVPLKRLLSSIDRPGAVGYALFRTKAREDRYRWIAPLTPSVSIVLVKLRSRTDVDAGNVEQAKAYRVGVLAGNDIYDYLLKLGYREGDNLFAATRNEQNIAMLYSGRLDFLAMRETSLRSEWIALGHPPKEAEIVQVLYDDGPAWLLCGKDSPDELVQRLREACEAAAARKSLAARTEEFIRSRWP